MTIKKVLVSQPKPTSEKSPYYEIAEKYGVKIDFRPFIKVESLTAREFRQQKVSILDYTAIVFTSRHAIDHFFHLCTDLRVTIPETMKYFCVTESIALYIQKYVQYRKRKIFFGNTGKFEDLLPAIQKHKTEKYLVPMSDVHNDDIKHLLDKAKVQHTEVVMYRTVSNDFQPGEDFDYDMLVFFSPAGISSLKKNFPDFDQKDIKIGTFGSTTAQAVRDAGLRLDLEAPSVQAPSMPAALDLFLYLPQIGAAEPQESAGEDVCGRSTLVLVLPPARGVHCRARAGGGRRGASVGARQRVEAPLQAGGEAQPREAPDTRGLPPLQASAARRPAPRRLPPAGRGLHLPVRRPVRLRADRRAHEGCPGPRGRQRGLRCLPCGACCHG